LDVLLLLESSIIILTWCIEIDGNGDWPDTVSWGLLIDGIISNGAWRVGGFILSEAWFEDLEEPEILWVHASLSAISMDFVDGVVLLLWFIASIAAWSSWLSGVLPVLEFVHFFGEEVVGLSGGH